MSGVLLTLHHLWRQFLELKAGGGEANTLQMLDVFGQLMRVGWADDAQDAELVNLAHCTAATAAMRTMFELSTCPCGVNGVVQMMLKRWVPCVCALCTSVYTCV